MRASPIYRAYGILIERMFSRTPPHLYSYEAVALSVVRWMLEFAQFRWGSRKR
jgi:hypothetical protein